jgi:hypothetical protein
MARTTQLSVTGAPARRADCGHAPADVAILLAGIVEGTMRRGIKPELHDEFLREVAKIAEGMRSV